MTSFMGLDPDELIRFSIPKIVLPSFKLESKMQKLEDVQSKFRWMLT